MTSEGDGAKLADAAVGGLLKAVGLPAAEKSALNVVESLFESYLLELLQAVHSYCEHAHRTRANILDVQLAMEDRGLTTKQLREHWLKWRDTTRPQPTAAPRRLPPADFRPDPNPVVAEQIPPKPKYALSFHPQLPYRYTFDQTPAPPPKPPSEVTQRVAELQRIREVRSHLLEAIAARRELFPEVLVSFTNFESAADVRDLVRRGLLTRPVDEIEPTPIGDGVLPRRSNALGLDQTRSWADHLEQEADQVQQLETFVADKEIPSAPGAALENHTMAYEEMLEPVEPLQEPSAHLFGQDMAHEPFHPAGVPGGIDIEEFGELINQQLPMEAPMEQPPLPRIMPRTLGDDDDDDEDEQFMVVG